MLMGGDLGPDSLYWTDVAITLSAVVCFKYWSSEFSLRILNLFLIEISGAIDFFNGDDSKILHSLIPGMLEEGSPTWYFGYAPFSLGSGENYFKN